MTFFRNRRLWKLFALASLLLAWTTPAFAGGTLDPAGGNAWELYVFGNGQVVYAILNSVSAMVSDPGYHDLLEFVGVLGIFGAAIVSGFDASKMPRMLAFVIGAFIVLYVSLDVTSNIMVEDPVTNYTNVATGVPAVVGVPAAVISDVGHWLTTKIEQDFSLPQDLTVSGGDGFDLANNLAQAATQAQILDPYLRNSFSNYVQNCVIPELANGTMNADTLLNATNLWGSMQVNNGGVLTPYYSSSSPNGTLMSCTNAYTAITTALTNESQTLLTANSSQWGGSGLGATLISNELQSSLAYLSNNTVNQPADQSILQAAAINMFNGSAMQQSAALTGNNGMMISMALAQSTQAQESSWFTGAQIFNSLMGYIYSVLQAFLFAITPILMAALLIPGFGFAILKNFAQVLLWLMLWQPMLAIVNYIMSLYGQQAYGGVMASAGGLTDMNLPVISEQASHMVLAAGFLGTMVPMISWGLVKGSLAFSDFIMAAGGGAFASQAAQQSTTGNVTLDNQSMNNDSFNSKNFAHSMSSGMPAMDVAEGLGAVNHNEMVGGLSARDAAGALQQQRTSGNSASTGLTGSSATSNTSTNSEALARKAAASREESRALSNASATAQSAMDKMSASNVATAAQNATYTTLKSTSAGLSRDTAQGAAASIDRSLSLQANALGFGLGGIKGLEDAGLTTGAEAAVEKTAADGGSAEDIMKASGGKLSKAQAEAVLAKRAQNLKKIKDGDPAFKKKAQGYIQGVEKWADSTFKNKAVRDAAVAAGVMALAAGAFVGVDEVVGLVGAVGAGVTEALGAAEGGEAVAGAAEGAEAVEGSAEGAEGAEAADGPAEGEGRPGGRDSNAKRDPKEKDPEKAKAKKGKWGQGLRKALEAAATNGSISSAFKQTNSSGAKQQISQTGTQSNSGADSAGTSTSVSSGQEYMDALQNTLQAIAAASSKQSSGADEALQRLRTAQQQVSAAQTAAITKQSGSTASMTVALGGGAYLLGQEVSAAQGKAPTNVSSETPAAQAALQQDQAGSMDAQLAQRVGAALPANVRQLLNQQMSTPTGGAPAGYNSLTGNVSQGLTARQQALQGRVLAATLQVEKEYSDINGKALSANQFIQKVYQTVNENGAHVSRASVMQMLKQGTGEALHDPGSGTSLAPMGSRGLLPGGGHDTHVKPN